MSLLDSLGHSIVMHSISSPAA